MYWDHPRSRGVTGNTNTHLDLGPWPDVRSYLKSLTNYERTGSEITPNTQLDLYDKDAQYFTPTDERFLRSTITLLDSNGCNIFLSEEALLRDGSIEITTVDDWQHTIILPLYITACFPTFIEKSTANEGQDEAEFLKNYLRKAYHALYLDFDPAWASALSLGIPASVSKVPPLSAQACWHAGYADLRKDLIRVALDWQNATPGRECPISAEGFTQKDLVGAQENQVGWKNAGLVRTEIGQRVGLGHNGAVLRSRYNSAVRTNQELFQQALTSRNRIM